MKTALLIPIYEPNCRVLPFLSSFTKDDFDDFLVVDDGSGEKFASKFKDVENNTVFPVFSYPKNHGKGYALKKGIEELLKKNPDLDYIITADGDGQHTRKDILRVKDKAIEVKTSFVLGCRTLEQMLPNSQNGRKWATFYFKVATGFTVSDSQSGLRAIPKTYFPLALKTYGDRYEYETNFLLAIARQERIEEIEIETIYFDAQNSDSHYRLFRDSLRISAASLIYLFISNLIYLLNLGIYAWVAATLFKNCGTSILDNLYTSLISFGVCATIEYPLLNYLTFHHIKGFGWSLPKYILSSLVGFAISFLFIDLMCLTGYRNVLLWKAIIDILIGIGHYIINHYFVFVSYAKKK